MELWLRFNWLRIRSTGGLHKVGNFLSSQVTVSFSRRNMLHGVSRKKTKVGYVVSLQT